MSTDTTPFVPFTVTFTTPLDCASIFPEGGTATGANILDASGRFTLIGAGLNRVIGEISGLTSSSGDTVKAAVEAAIHP